MREAGGPETFFQSFVAEAHAIIRANVTARGGNALLCYKLVPREVRFLAFQSGITDEIMKILNSYNNSSIVET